ncbi:methyltransferase domain-containing protein, partial [Nonomuraea deserti]
MNHDRVHFAYNGIDVDPETQELTRSRLHWLLDRLPSGRILDLGCSQGTLSVLAARRGDRVIGVDVEEEAVAFAAGLAAELPADTVGDSDGDTGGDTDGDTGGDTAGDTGGRLAFVRGDGERLCFPDGCFDAAVAGELLEHVADPRAVLTELHRVLAPGGTLLVSVPHGLMPHHDHRRTFYRAGLRRLINPLFKVGELTVLPRHIAVVAVRREAPRPVPAYRLSQEESDFLQREERLEEQARGLRDKLARANRLYRDVTAANAELKERLGASGAGQQVLDQLSALQDTVTRLSTELAGSAAAERNELQERLDALADDRDRLRAGLRAAETELGLLREAAGATEEERDRLLESIHGLTAGMESLRETADAVAAQRDELRALVRAQAEDLQAAEAAHGEATRTAEDAHARALRSLHARVAELDEEHRTQRAELSRLRTVYNGERHRHSLTQHRLDKLVTAESKLRQENARLRDKLEAVTGRLADYRDQVSRIRSSRAWRVLSVYRQLRRPGRPDPGQPGGKAAASAVAATPTRRIVTLPPNRDLAS